MPYRRVPLETDPIIVFYDLETSHCTGLPFIITFAIYNCFTKCYVDLALRNRFYDCEIPVYHAYEIKYFYKIISLMLVDTYKIYLMAYNGNKFDHLYMLKGIKMQYFKRKGNTVLCAAFKAYGNLYETRDLRDYITTGNLADIGNTVNCPKLTTGFNDLHYAIRDTTIMCKAWNQIILANYGKFTGEQCRPYQLICYRSTAAISYEFVCRSLKVEKFFVCNEVNEYLKLSYYGAKCDYSQIGLSTGVSMYDIRSMYPAAMKELMPCGEMYVLHNTLYEEPTAMYIATVTLFKRTTNDINIDSTFGVIPTKHYGHTQYVTGGKITTVMTSIDVKNAALDGWGLLKMKDVIIWSHCDKLFNVYDKLFTVKQSHTKDTPEYWFSKIVMNSSIGKFASGGDYIPHYINYFCMSYSRSMLVSLKCMMRKCDIPLVIYGDTDSIVLYDSDMTKLVKRYPCLLSDKLADDVLVPTGEIECANEDIIVLGKKLYYIHEKKYSAKGHNHAEITKQLFLDVLNGIECKTSRMSPDKFIIYNEITKIVNSGVSPFCNHTRAVNATYNNLKQRIGNTFVGPVIINI